MARDVSSGRILVLVGMLMLAGCLSADALPRAQPEAPGGDADVGDPSGPPGEDSEDSSHDGEWNPPEPPSRDAQVAPDCAGDAAVPSDAGCQADAGVDHPATVTSGNDAR